MPTSGRYSQNARRAMMQARLIAWQEEHNVVDIGHLLAGILRAEGSLGQRVLLELGLDRASTEQALPALYERGSHPTARAIPMTQTLRTALTFAVAESRTLGHHYIGTEHLLLGLARGGAGPAEQLLHQSAISVDQIRRQVRRVLGEGETEIGLERALRMARLSELSRRVLARASLIAADLQQPTTDLMHLALALAQERRSPAGRILRQCGLDEARLTAEIPWPRPADPMLLEEVLDEAVLVAERLGSHYTGTDHIVYVLAHNRHGARILARYGVALRWLAQEIDTLLRENN